MDASRASLRAIVVTLDPPRARFAPGAPARVLREAGCEVAALGYDPSELYPTAEVVVVVAGEHLEIGRDAIKRLRQRPELLQARFLLCLDVSRMSGLDPETGADDFILMPFEPAEIWARVRSLRWRDKRPGKSLQLQYDGLVLDCEMRQAYRGPDTLGLTPLEFQLLRFLVERVGRVYSRNEILSRVWGYHHLAGRGRTVDTHVLNLRAKLGEVGTRLVSVRGLGYKLERVVPLAEAPAGPAPAQRSVEESWIEEIPNRRQQL
jgi:DNA-binding response OmpR family regulator